MKINESIEQELSQLVDNYFVITKEISEKISIINKLNEGFSKQSDGYDKKILGELKKETYLYQFLNVFLVKNISNIKLLYKLSKLASIELEKDYEERVITIMESDPETMAIENNKIVVIDETLQNVLDGSLKEVSDEEVKEVLKQQLEDEESK